MSAAPRLPASADPRPLIAHVVYRFDVGGLENGVVNLINHLPAEDFRHAVIALTEVTEFRRRVQRDDVQYFSLGKPPGHALRIYPELFRLFRALRPDIVHTRNLAALEATVPAWAAGIPVRIHGEHGREGDDLAGRKRKYRWIRRIYSPFVTKYIALSRELAEYLQTQVGIAPARIARIYNGVDARKFQPAAVREPIAGCPFVDGEHWLFGTVGRMQAVKDQPMLARAFVRALALVPELRERLRLVMIGDGPLRGEVEAILAQGGVAPLAWLPGERNDVPSILRGLDCFVLPSLSEGISNVILEAMASGLPVIATAVGGNGELVADGESGLLVPAGDSEALARRIVELATAPARARAMGLCGRQAIETGFSLDSMVQRYRRLYDETRSGRGAEAPCRG